MKLRLISVLNIVMAGALTGLLVQPGIAWSNPEPMAADDAPTTEDIILMNDGRELHGQILSETKRVVVFEYMDTTLNVKTKLTLLMDEISQVRRDVALGGSAPAPEPGSSAAQSSGGGQAAPAAPPKSAKTGSGSDDRKYGVSRVTSSDAKVASFYVVPIRGQMGTDVRAEVYEDIVKDIKSMNPKPSLIILEVECSDTSDRMNPEGYDGPKLPPDWRKRESGILDFDNSLKLALMFRDDLRDIPQVVWVHDADGISSNLVMAWERFYMSPSGRLGGMIQVLSQSNADKWADSDIRAKMMSAWLGKATAFLEKGKYQLALAEAMLDPTKSLSGKWEGRQVKWSLNADGEFVVDSNEKGTANFTAKSAEDYCISQGTAADLDDLALLLGYREYRPIEGKQAELITGYIDAWRRSYKNTQEWWTDYQINLGYASGEDAMVYLGKARKNLEDIVRAMTQYKAVEVRWEKDFGVPKEYLEVLIEQLKERIQALKKSTAGGTRGGAGGGRSGQGGGGRGRE